MAAFGIDPARLAAARKQALARGRSGESRELEARLRAGEALDDEGLAALFLSPEVSTESLLDVAREHRAPGGARI